MPNKLRTFLLMVIIAMVLTQASCQDDDDDGIDELDAVIEFDSSDDLFKILPSKPSTVVHLYSRKDSDYLNKRKAFRRAAKRDIDRAAAEKDDVLTQWVAIDRQILSDKASTPQGSSPDAEIEEYDEAKVLAVFGVHQPLTFYGYLNMKASIEFPIAAAAESGDNIVNDAVEAILIEKKKRIQKLLPVVSCSQLDGFIATSDRPTVAYFGKASLYQGVSSKTSFLKHIHQANLMAFDQEQHNFVAVIDLTCIRGNGFSTNNEDWTLVYYPAASPEDTSDKIKVKKVQQHSAGSNFSETVLWLDRAFAEDKGEWNKHASVCLTSHKMNLLVLFLDTKSIAKTQRYASTISTFRKAITDVISAFNLNIIPVIYPVQKMGSFSDTSERLEDIIGANFESVPLPQISLIHGFSRKSVAFQHAIMDEDAFTADLVGYWAINTLLKEDLKMKESKLSELREKLEDKQTFALLNEQEQQDTEFQYNLSRRDASDIERIMPRAEHAYEFAQIESKWSGHMKSLNITDVQERRQFLRELLKEEVEEKFKQEQAKDAMANLVRDMEAGLIAEGYTNEEERLRVLIERLQQEEARQAEDRAATTNQKALEETTTPEKAQAKEAAGREKETHDEL